MGLVEAIGSKLFHQVEYFVSLFLADAVLGRAGHKDGALLGHGLGLFLAHGAAQKVSAAQRVVGDDLGDLHDLFLVDNDAVGVFQAAFQGGVRIDDLYLAVLALDEFIHHAGSQGAWAVEGKHGDDVFKAGGAEHAQILAHA